jgi:RNA polymerase sigma factor (sigma-70 family)
MTRDEYGIAFQQDFERTIGSLAARGVRSDDAREIAQAAWTRGLERICQLRNEQSVIEWVNTITRRRLLTSFRQNRLVDLSQMKHEPAAAPSVNLAAIDVRRALQECKPHERKLLEDFYWRGYSSHEFATQTGKSVGAIHAALCRARKALREHMQVTRRQVLPGESVLRMKVRPVLEEKVSLIGFPGAWGDQASLMKKGLA